MAATLLEMLNAGPASPEKVRRSLDLIEQFKSCRFLFVDCETNGDDIRDGRGYATGVSVAGKISGELVSAYFPFRHGTGGNLPSEVLLELRKLLALPIPKATHNIKFDLVACRTLGIELGGGILYCSLLIAHLINENRPFAYDLTSVAKWYLGLSEENQKLITEDFQKYIKHFGWANIPVDLMDPYATRDAELGFRALARIMQLFKEEGLEEYWEHKRKFVDVIIAMESRGVLVDVELCNQQAAIGEERMAEIIKELGGLSPSSPKDLYELLIVRLGLEVHKVSEKTGKPSFDKYAMELYEDDLAHLDVPVAKLILEFRGWQKSVSSNYKPYVELLSPDGALRPNYKLHGTKTGRMSCEKPNLQQIPRVSDKPWNGHMKKAFIAREGYVLLEADYSQLELRLSTAYAREQALIEVFEEGRDIFTEMSLTLGMPRQDTKTFVYSTQYGAGVRRIKTALGISETKARQIRENYFRTYPGFRRISDIAQQKAINRGKVRIWSGRYRHFFNPQEESHKALNSIIQGGAADIVERVMVRLFELVDQPSNDECRMLLQVHDSVVFEVKKDKVDFYKEKIHSVMEDVDAVTGEPLGVRFHVDIKEWGS